MPKAVLLLDIDGTISPYFASSTLKLHPEKLPGFEEHSIESKEHGSARVYLQTKVLKEKLSTLEKMGVQVIWASAWNEASNLILSMLYSDADKAYPTIIFPEEIDFSLEIQSWKLSTVKEYMNANFSDSTPLIWLDDEIFDDAKKWLEGRAGVGLMIRPDRHIGITEDNWNLILELAETLE